MAERNAGTYGSARELFWLPLCTFGVYNAITLYSIPSLRYRIHLTDGRWLMGLLRGRKGVVGRPKQSEN